MKFIVGHHDHGSTNRKVTMKYTVKERLDIGRRVQKEDLVRREASKEYQIRLLIYSGNTGKEYEINTEYKSSVPVHSLTVSHKNPAHNSTGFHAFLVRNAQSLYFCRTYSCLAIKILFPFWEKV